MDKKNIIEDNDWAEVTSLSVEIVNLDEQGKSSEEVELELINYLRSLEDKYGRNPRVLGTLADYLDDIDERLALYKEAFELAEKDNDHINKTIIAGSLLELFLEEVQDYGESSKWLDILNECRKHYSDEYYDASVNTAKEAIEEKKAVNA